MPAGSARYYRILTRVSGADERVLEAVRDLFIGLAPTARDAFTAATDIKRHLSRQGFRDDWRGFGLCEMADVHGGNCLGLSLLIGAELEARGFAPRFEIRVNPHDDVHGAGEEYFALLTDTREGVDCDSRLPTAGDCTSRFRFTPAEHASLRLEDATGQYRPFESTGLDPARVFEDPGWAPEAESLRAVEFAELASSVFSERAKAILCADRASGQPSVANTRRATLLALRAVRMWPRNREAWAQVWESAGLLAACRARLSRRCQLIAARASHEYLALAGTDSLWHFTNHRMRGDERDLAVAVARFPSYAAAYYAANVSRFVSADLDDDERERIQRHFIIAAWCHAESEILDLEDFYRKHQAEFVLLFGDEEVSEILESFS